ncbi:MAG: hypothetical protein ACLT8E_12005 [Akkermansia sp.]
MDHCYRKAKTTSWAIFPFGVGLIAEGKRGRLWVLALFDWRGVLAPHGGGQKLHLQSGLPETFPDVMTEGERHTGGWKRR